MADNENEKPISASEKYIPPPMDPYATYQTPYERRQEDRNPFIEFRRFADKQVASMFEGLNSLGLPQMFNLADERMKFRERFEKDMQALEDQRQGFHEDIRRRIEHATAELARKAQDAAPERLVESTINSAPKPVSSDEGIIPDGWIQATTSDGKRYFIEHATGTATKEIPSEATIAMPHGWETKTARSGCPYYVNHTDRTTTWEDPRNLQLVQHANGLSTQERADTWKRGFRSCPELKHLSTETELDVYEKLDEEQQQVLSQLSRQIRERSEQWKRGFNNCPELKALGADSELDVYEKLDEEQQQDLAQLSRQIRKKNEQWKRGFENCPELRKFDDGTELSMYERLNKENAWASDRKAACPWAAPKGGWSWWPTIGHDGMQRARHIPLAASTRNRPNDRTNEDLQGHQRESLLLEEQRKLGEIVELAQQEQDAVMSGAETLMRLMSKTPNSFGDSATDEYPQSVPNVPLIVGMMLGLPRSAFEEPNADDLAAGYNELARNQDFKGYSDDFHDTRGDLKRREHHAHKDAHDESAELQHKVPDFHEKDKEQRTKMISSTSTESSDDGVKSSIVATMTRTTSKTLPDGSIETRRTLRKRFADGREEAEESTEISQAAKAANQQPERPGWFWN
ncbi:hypothetical protein PMZ80_006256 [Knufia obscura]|uniref:WW domain-containing protein n=2 Tax=Knufia TaxID=430999 RepID=A0AAN8I5V8_9EURO|nr:hypothetical protein PMZ80_006256 [Knufia obscura]KAK5953599.1 hypothetical protein OHC33_005543 [Knufia fluminis]